jgi:putative Mg2+ transporter-C (MgtC) family protein
MLGFVLSSNEQIAVRLTAALLIGAGLGLNRELHGKAAGLRTHALVGLGAAAATMVAIGSPGSSMVGDSGTVGRVVQGILTGIGFLGAGVILRDPSGHIQGLTTAATIWICAVLGIVCGVGDWRVLGIALGLTVLVLVFGPSIERVAERLFRKRREPGSADAKE